MAFRAITRSRVNLLGQYRQQFKSLRAAVRHGAGFCLGAYLAQVAAGLRLAQIHGCQPLATGQFFQITGFQGIAAVRFDAVIRAV